MSSKGMLETKRGDFLIRIVRTLGYALMCVPVAASFLYVRAFGVDVPVTDTWVMVPLFEKLFSGQLVIGDLWAQHYEHRPFLPRIFLLLMGPLADFNNMTIMYATQLFLLITLACILLAYINTLGFDTKHLFFAVPIPFLVFNFGQYWNMFLAWSIHVVAVVSFGVLSFLLIDKMKEGGRITLLYLAALLSGSAATLSAGHGLLIWPVGILQLFLAPVHGTKNKFFLASWGLAGIAHWTIYFWGYETSTSSAAGPRYFFNSPTLGLDYFVGLIGSALFRDSTLAVVTGSTLVILLLLVTAWVIKGRQQQQYAFWLSLSTFSLLILAATTVGRSGPGLGEAIQSKYVTFSVLLTIAIYVMLLKMARDHDGWLDSSVLSLVVCIVLILSSVPSSYHFGLNRAEVLSERREKAAHILYNYENRNDTLLNQAVRHSDVRDEAAFLDDLGYTVFSETSAAARDRGEH